jgi:hypothetical protein
MLKKIKFFIFLCCLSAVFFVTLFSVNAQDRLTDKSQVFINGIGPVRVAKKYLIHTWKMEYHNVN